MQRQSVFGFCTPRFVLSLLLITMGAFAPTLGGESAANANDSEFPRAVLDGPVLFCKRLNYLGIHIYDTFYKWRPGGGIYIIENPADPPEKHRIRPLIDATTPETLGEGVYTDPDLSYDATKVLFCFKGTENGSTKIYEIGIDGKGLRCLSQTQECCCNEYKGNHGGHHDVTPCYLPDGRILFTSTRFAGLVPCANNGVAIMHVMNADGSDVHPISVNNVNEFDPSVLPDGRILFGRWEYIDKTALTQQSLWSVLPDGTLETAVYANNMVKPEAILDARAVPGEEHLICGSFTPHNSGPRGCIGMLDPRLGKNDPGAIFNFDAPDQPTKDTGFSCEPWPLSRDVVLYSGRPEGAPLNVLMLADRSGKKVVVASDPEFDLHSPIIIAPRPKPPVIGARRKDDSARTGRFFVQDIYRGMPEVERGKIKSIRVIEEMSRISPQPKGSHGLNQTFLVSAALAFSAKHYLGAVPVEPDGSAYFEVPAGKAVYFQALDEEGRLVRSMRTFLQAAPGTTRSCIGCHEPKYSAAVANHTVPSAFTRHPSRLEPESWGTGAIDYPTMIQPIFDKHCVSCHGGEEGFAGGLDLSGGWTRLFNISYENLANRSETQLVASYISAIDCMNGTANYSAQILPAYSHGSGNAPLADVLLSGHEGAFPKLTRTERDLVLAWIDTNGLYYGTWNYSEAGCALDSWTRTRDELQSAMVEAGCAECHGDGPKITRFENDWFNLQRPEMSRILRAPLAEGGGGHGIAWCRKRKVDPAPRLRIMTMGGYVHHVLPLGDFPTREPVVRDDSGEPAVSFKSTDDPAYQKMLSIIRRGRSLALAAPRVDMPGATVIAGESRYILPPEVPSVAPEMAASVNADAVVRLSWNQSAEIIGLTAEIHRADKNGFPPSEKTRLGETRLFEYEDSGATAGTHCYALVLREGDRRSAPRYLRVDVPTPSAPEAASGFSARATVGGVVLGWDVQPRRRYHVYRKTAEDTDFTRLTDEPILGGEYADSTAPMEEPSDYAVAAVSPRGLEGPKTDTRSATPMPVPQDAVLDLSFATKPDAATFVGPAAIRDGCLDLDRGGHLELAPREDFSPLRGLTVECTLRFDEKTQMPVVVSSRGVAAEADGFCNFWAGGGDGMLPESIATEGRSSRGRWVTMTAVYDGKTARLYQDGRQVAACNASAHVPWHGKLLVGQYSGGPGEPYQVKGRVKQLRVFRRALGEEEIASAGR